jgi:hypothetical protein
VALMSRETSNGFGVAIAVSCNQNCIVTSDPRALETS